MVREQEARQLLTDLQVEYEGRPGVTYSAFTRVAVDRSEVNEPGQKRAYYIETAEAVVLPDVYEQMILEAKAEADHWVKKYGHIVELHEVAVAMKQAISKTKAVKRQQYAAVAAGV